MSPCSFTVTWFPQLSSMPLTFELSGGLDICPFGISSHASAPPYRESVQSWGNSHVENSSAKLGGPRPPTAPLLPAEAARNLRVCGSASGGEGPDRNTWQPLEGAGRKPEATWKLRMTEAGGAAWTLGWCPPAARAQGQEPSGTEQTEEGRSMAEAKEPQTAFLSIAFVS